MQQSFMMRHRLKLFIACLVVVCALGGLIATSKLDAIKKDLFESMLAENQGAGFGRLVSVLSEAGAYVEAQTEPGSEDRAQGYRYAMRQMAQWQSLFMTDGNSRAPSMSRCPSRMCKYGFDNPDTVYLMVHPISPDTRYLLKGRAGTLAYTTYQVFGIAGAGGFQTGGSLETADIVMPEGGRFEILISVDNPENHPNHITIPQGRGGQLVIRQLMRDWNTETENAYTLEVLPAQSDVPHPPKPLTLDMYDRRAFGLAQFVANSVKGYREILAASPVNELPKGTGGSGVGDGGFPTNYTAQMRYEIGEDEALLIEVPKVDVVYSNIQLGSAWGESLVYQARTASFNDFQAHLDADGVYRYVIAQSDPGVPNWLDATGHPAGGVFHRWQSPEEDLPTPVTRRVKLSELRAYLPENHPQFTPAMRVEQLRQRHAGFLRRQNPVY